MEIKVVCDTQGFLLMELIIALMLTILLSGVALEYLAHLIVWNKEVLVRHSLVQSLKQQATSFSRNKKIKSSYQSSSSTIIATTPFYGAIEHTLPFSLPAPLRFFSLAKHEAKWVDAQGTSHIFSLISGRCT